MKLLAATLLVCFAAAYGNETFVKLVKCGACVAGAVKSSADRDSCQTAAKAAYGAACSGDCGGLQQADGDLLASASCAFEPNQFGGATGAYGTMDKCYKCTSGVGSDGTLDECKKRRADACGDMCKETGGFLAHFRDIEVGKGCDAEAEDLTKCYTHMEGQLLYGLNDIRSGTKTDCANDVDGYYKKECPGDTTFTDVEDAIMELCKAAQ